MCHDLEDSFRAKDELEDSPCMLIRPSSVAYDLFKGEAASVSRRSWIKGQVRGKLISEYRQAKLLPPKKKEEEKEKIDISCKKSPLEGRRLLEPKCPF